MKWLNGKELAGFIKERQARQVRGLRQAAFVVPKLAIIITVDHPAIATYVRMKERYGADIGIETAVHRVPQTEVPGLIAKLNADSSVHGIIVQLPLADPSQTDKICSAVVPAKDVDALGKEAVLEPATPLAILWLLAGYNIALALSDARWIPRGTMLELAERPTADFLYVRWMGPDREITDYSHVQFDRSEEIRAWSEVLKHAANTKEIYGFFNNHFAGHSPASAREMQGLLGQQPVDPESLGGQRSLF
jgi:hypothetical protein